MFMHKMHTLLSYVQAFEEDYGVQFVDMPLKEIVKDKMSSKVLAAYSSITYIRNISAGTMIIKHEGVLFVLGKMGTNSLDTRTFGITNVDDESLYNSPEEYILLIALADDAFAKNDYKLAPFHACSIYRYGRAMLYELHLRHSEQEKKKFYTLALFLDTKI